jgi:poly-gamma-glutamate synthesis protein (capsule biosynthesis protein)
MRKSPLAILIVSGPLVVAAIGFWLTREPPDLRPVDIPAAGPLTIALAGDVLLTSPLGPELRDPEFLAVRDEVRRAHVAAANLEMNLLGAEQALNADAHPAPRWPYGSALDAETLKYLGFDALSLANDHAADYGPDGTVSTMRILDEAGLLHAGTGSDLAGARAAVFAGPRAPRGAGKPPADGSGATREDSTGAPRPAGGRLAFVSVTTSSFPEARATASRADIAGRPGLNPLRYTADITVDAATFQTLKDSVESLNAGPAPGDRELLMFGTPIKRGDRTSVDFVVDAQDERAILDVIEAARGAAEIVIVALHSHEPANASDEPAAFVQRFARAAIDRGASLIVGHGPHRLRAVEMYKGSAILYSLGNFLYQTTEVDFRAANMFDAGTDLYRAAVGAADTPGIGAVSLQDEPSWWEGLLAEATFEGGRLVGLRLRPLDLGVEKSQVSKGIPRFARGDRARQIMGHLAALSALRDTSVQVHEDMGLVRVISP